MKTPSTSVTLDAETARLHHRVRVALIELLVAATPDGWEVDDTSSCTTVRLDVAVRPCRGPGAGPAALPVLCVDLSGGEDPEKDRHRQARRHALARIGVDHYWDLDTATGTLDVHVRRDDEYRHAERVTGADWLDFGIGLVHVDLPLLLGGRAGPGAALRPVTTQEHA